MSKQNAGKRGTRLPYVQLFLLCLRVTSVLGSMNDAPWACSVHCADSGRCGDGEFYNYYDNLFTKNTKGEKMMEFGVELPFARPPPPP